MRAARWTVTLAVCLASSSLLACANDDDDDEKDRNPPVTGADSGVNASNDDELDSSVAAPARDGGFGDILGDADIGSFFTDGGINQDAICARFPQACVDGSIVFPGRGDGGMLPRPDGGFDRDGGPGRRDGGRDRDASEPADDAGDDASP